MWLWLFFCFSVCLKAEDLLLGAIIVNVTEPQEAVDLHRGTTAVVVRLPPGERFSLQNVTLEFPSPARVITSGVLGILGGWNKNGVPSIWDHSYKSFMTVGIWACGRGMWGGGCLGM